MSSSPLDSEDVVLRLTKQEALVLFELLSRFSETKKLGIEDQAEERVLWDLCCDLEKKITQPLSADYATKLADARRSIRD
jgi:hypothetical protein